MAQKRKINWVMVILIIIFLWFLFSDNTYVEQPQPVEEQTAQVKVKVAYPILEQTALGNYPSTAQTKNYTVSLNYVDAATSN